MNREQRAQLARHQITQRTGCLGFYRMRCSCGAESKLCRQRSKSDAWKATQWVLRHGAQVARDLGIVMETRQ